MKPEWKDVKLKDLCRDFKSDIVDGPFGSNLKKEHFVNTGVPVLKIQNIKPFEIIDKKIDHITHQKAAELSRHSFEAGDILMTKLGNPLGASAIVSSIKRGVIVADLVRVRAEKIDINFLCYQLNSPKIQKEINSQQKGTTRPRVRISVVRDLNIAVPTFVEQKRIVAILDEAFEKIDRAIANTEKNIANARELFDSELEAAFCSNNAGLEARNLSELCTKIGSGATPKGGSSSYKAEGISLVRSLNVHDRRFSYPKLAFIDNQQAAKLNNVTLEYGDVLLNITGASVTRCCTLPSDILPARVNQHVSILRPKSELLDSGFLCYLLTSQSTKKRLLGIGEDGGSTRQAITKAQLEDFKVDFPSTIDEQITLRESLKLMEERTAALVLIYKTKLEHLINLKQSLLQKAFAGELTTSKTELQRLEVDTTTPEFTAKLLGYGHHKHANENREQTYGRVKSQKWLHLVEAIGNVELDRNPFQDAAGPNDFNHMLQAEKWAKHNQFFEYVKRPTGVGYDFKKLAKYDVLISDAYATVKPFRGQIDRVLDLLLPMKSQKAEVFATVYAAWNNLIIDGKAISDEAIVTAAREDWHKDKLKIKRERFFEAIKQIMHEKIEPNGSAKYVGGQEELCL